MKSSCIILSITFSISANCEPKCLKQETTRKDSDHENRTTTLLMGHGIAKVSRNKVCTKQNIFFFFFETPLSPKPAWSCSWTTYSERQLSRCSKGTESDFTAKPISSQRESMQTWSCGRQPVPAWALLVLWRWGQALRRIHWSRAATVWLAVFGAPWTSISTGQQNGLTNYCCISFIEEFQIKEKCWKCCTFLMQRFIVSDSLFWASTNMKIPCCTVWDDLLCIVLVSWCGVVPQPLNNSTLSFSLWKKKT